MECPQNNDIPKRTVEKIAEQHKVSHDTVKRAEKFAEAVDKIAETAGQEVKQKILSREIDLSQRCELAYKLKELLEPKARENLKQSPGRPPQSVEKGFQKSEKVFINTPINVTKELAKDAGVVLRQDQKQDNS